MNSLKELKASVVRVGRGRGFVVSGKDDSKLVVTAGHCLPGMPPCMNFSDLGERTFRSLIGPIGEDPTISVECLFVDPISDLAILGPPDNQDLSEECDAYEAFVEPLTAFSVANIPPTPLSHDMSEGEVGWVLSLADDDFWQQCRMRHVGGPLWLSGLEIEGGMSGSPILSAGWEAVGIIASNHAQPRLLHSLPFWMLKPVLQQTMRKLETARKKKKEAKRAASAGPISTHRSLIAAAKAKPNYRIARKKKPAKRSKSKKGGGSSNS